ncbi:hypothetical protein [uncultured Bacteroides sp.]|uniref:hypothetical protein n=1 Tax=uncultured Bacteroides sp. TaxID=162156 RepID=UPI003747FA15
MDSTYIEGEFNELQCFLESVKLTIECIRIEFMDGTEIRNRGIKLLGAIEQLHNLAL